MVQKCKQRPYGMSVSEWCQENSITTANYYYRMSQVRKACMDSLPVETIEQSVVPVSPELIHSASTALEELDQRKSESCIEISAHPKRVQPIPSVYTINEIKRIEQHIDTGTDTGKRNIAIIRLATRMGLRSGDIVKLTIDEIDFSSGTIHLIQEKTGTPLELQMPQEVSDSIYMHLENSKKKHYPDRYVFHSMTAPYERITTSIIRHLVNDSMNKAGIEVGSRKLGPHAFRASLASHMISDSNSYDVVRKILGHSDPNVIKHYAKTDIERLRLCAISPPRPSGLFEEYLSGKKVFRHV